MRVANLRRPLAIPHLVALAWPLHYAALAAVVLVAAFLRLTALSRQSLWFDEADVVVRAQRPLRDVLTTFTVEGENGPLYNLMLALWIRAAGISEVAVRFPSAVAGVLAIPVIYLLARRLIGPTTGLFAAALLAISPYHVWYSQEAKMYAIVVLLGLLSTLLLVEGLERNEWPWWAAYVAVTTLMFYTHVAAVLVFAAHGLFVILTHRRWGGRWKTIGVSAALLTIPYVPIALWALDVVGGEVTTWQPDVDLVEAVRIIGVKFATNRADAGIEFRAGWLYAILALGGAAVLVYRRPIRWVAALLVSLAAVPLLGLYLASLHNSVFSDRYIIVSLPAYLILVAAAAVALVRSQRAWPLGFLAMAALVAFAWAPLEDVNRSAQARKEDWRSAYAHVAERAQTGDVLLLHPGYITTTLIYYEQRDPRLKEYPVATIPSFRVNWLTEAIMIDLLRIDVAPRNRFWLIQSPDRTPLEDPDHILEGWLDRTGKRLYEEEVNGVEVILYQLPDRWWEPQP